MYAGPPVSSAGRPARLSSVRLLLGHGVRLARSFAVLGDRPPYRSARRLFVVALWSDATDGSSAPHGLRPPLGVGRRRRTCGGSRSGADRRLYTKAKCGRPAQTGQAAAGRPERARGDESSRVHLPWQRPAVSDVQLVARSMVPWPAHRYPSDGRIASLSHRTHTRSPETENAAPSSPRLMACRTWHTRAVAARRLAIPPPPPPPPPPAPRRVTRPARGIYSESVFGTSICIGTIIRS